MAQHALFTMLERSSSNVVDQTKYLLHVSEKVESAKQNLLRMQAFVTDLDNRMRMGGAMAMILISELREVVYEVEDIIDAANILARQCERKTSIRGAISLYACFPIYRARLHSIGARIDSANARLKTIFEDFAAIKVAEIAIAEPPRGCITDTEDGAIQHWRETDPAFGVQADVIGFDEEVERIKDDLMSRGNMDLTVVSIVGPGGAGKSTLAKKVYGSPQVEGHFEVHAWITVSQRITRVGDLFKEMVKRIVGVQQAEEVENKTEHEATQLLHDFLGSKRYLIVLDDIWSEVVWDKIRAALPDTLKGSRVILTTRSEAVARYPDARKKILKPKLLNREQSTRLLLSKAFPEYMLDGSSSSNIVGAEVQNFDQLKRLGGDVAEKCCGLPLALVVLGGYLSRNHDVAEWERLMDVTTWDWTALISTDRIVGSMLELNFFDMTSHMRSCFMYTAAFPEDSSIDVPTLTRLWIAEGFVPLLRGHTREEVAAMYVAELVRRCMIQVEERAGSGRITMIKVHDLLRDWGISQARIEGLVKDCYLAQDVVGTDYQQEMIQAYRMVLHGFLLTRETAASSMRRLRTLLYFRMPAEAVQKSHGLKTLQHLRVLYLETWESTLISLPKEFGQMRYLRYLGFGGTGSYALPSSVGGLLSLETLHSRMLAQMHIPRSFWRIPTLKQVFIAHAVAWSVPQISSQSKVRVMVQSYAQDSPLQPMSEATKRQVSKNKENPNLTCCFMTRHTAHQLDILGRCGEEGIPFHDGHLLEFLDPDITVVKIRCANLLRNDRGMQELGWTMQRLRVLEIGERSYTGSVMTCPPGIFPSLERLSLHDLAVEEWRIERGSMERLSELTICKCPNLTGLPQGLLWLPHLRKLELVAMPLGTVAQELEKKGCIVSETSDEKHFQHLHLPISASTGTQ